jgi:hypothetical protein
MHDFTLKPQTYQETVSGIIMPNSRGGLISILNLPVGLGFMYPLVKNIGDYNTKIQV